MQKKLYRSRNNRMIAGVCAGLGEYFNVDPTLIRLIFVLVGLAGGPGLILYIIMAIVVPEEPFGFDNSDKTKNDWIDDNRE
jgi:phage shock protein PspC (stress-responsive transcriptional regulator)